MHEVTGKSPGDAGEAVPASEYRDQNDTTGLAPEEHAGKRLSAQRERSPPHVPRRAPHNTSSRGTPMDFRRRRQHQGRAPPMGSHARCPVTRWVWWDIFSRNTSRPDVPPPQAYRPLAGPVPLTFSLPGPIPQRSRKRRPLQASLRTSSSTISLPGPIHQRPRKRRLIQASLRTSSSTSLIPEPILRKYRKSTPPQANLRMKGATCARATDPTTCSPTTATAPRAPSIQAVSGRLNRGSRKRNLSARAARVSLPRRCPGRSLRWSSTRPSSRPGEITGRNRSNCPTSYSNGLRAPTPGSPINKPSRFSGTATTSVWSTWRQS